MNKEACFPDGLRRGAWTDEEDKLLSDYIAVHGVERWRTLPAKAGLNRCGKSCRLRWLNYLRPGIKKGNITEEEELIVRLHKLIGNRWSLIAGRIPGRTDNEIKNYWNTYLKKKIAKDTFDSQLSSKASPTPPSKEIPSMEKVSRRKREDSNMVQAKAYPCTKGLSRIEEGSLPAPPLDLGLCREVCFDDSVMGDVCSGSRLEESEFDY